MKRVSMMAMLHNLITKENIVLLAQHCFGRNLSANHTVVKSAKVSRLHALITWDGEHWLIKDSSTNGTYINGKRIVTSSQTRLSLNDLIQFGSPEAESWQLIDISPAVDMLFSQSGNTKTISLKQLTVLPGKENPEIFIYKTFNGSWICESAKGAAELCDGDLVGCDGNTWQFISAKPATNTEIAEEGSREVCRVEFYFDVSQNEEHVSLTIQLNGQPISLETRNHHYLLLYLARLRLADSDKDIDKKECGWISKDLLCPRLGMNEYSLNTQIYRLRKQLVQTLPRPELVHDVIERRHGELRIAYDAIHIEGGLKIPEQSSFTNNLAISQA